MPPYNRSTNGTQQLPIIYTHSTIKKDQSNKLSAYLLNCVVFDTPVTAKGTEILTVMTSTTPNFSYSTVTIILTTPLNSVLSYPNPIPFIKGLCIHCECVFENETD